MRCPTAVSCWSIGLVALVPAAAAQLPPSATQGLTQLLQQLPAAGFADKQALIRQHRAAIAIHGFADDAAGMLEGNFTVATAITRCSSSSADADKLN